MALPRPLPPALSMAPPQNTLLPSDWPVAQMTTRTHTKNVSLSFFALGVLVVIPVTQKDILKSWKGQFFITEPFEEVLLQQFSGYEAISPTLGCGRTPSR